MTTTMQPPALFDSAYAQLAPALSLGAVIPAPVRDLTALLVAALIVIGLLARAPAVRWTALLTALLIAPLLLAGVVLDDDRGSRLLDHPALLAGGVIGGLIVLAVTTAVLVRWASVLPVLVAVAMPLRLPLTIGDESVNLLLPLYLLIGAGALAFAIRARNRGKRLAQAWDLRSGPAHTAVLKEAWTQRSLSGAAAAVPVLLALSVAFYAARIPFSADADQGVQTLGFFLVPFATLFVVLRDVEYTPVVLWRVGAALVVLAVIAVLLGDYEYQTGQVLWKQNVLDANSLNQAVRVNSLFFDPNIYGRFLMVVLLGVLAALSWGARGWRAVGLAALLVLFWTGLLVTFSQSSMVGVLVGALVLLALRFGLARAALAGAGLAVCGAIAVFALGDVLRLDVSSKDSVSNATSGRSALIAGGIDLFEQKPITGWGSGSFRQVYRDETELSSVRAVAASHTIPVTIAVEQGIFGLAAYLALIGAAIIALLRRARATVARAAVAAAFIALVVHTWLYAAFLEDPLSWALLAVGLGLGAADEPVDPIAAGAPAEPPAPAADSPEAGAA